MSDLVYKSIEALTLKAPLGHFSARIAIYDTPDMAGDRIRRGAFQASLDQWARESKSVPVVWAHDRDVMSVLGKVTRWSEDAEGLVADGILDLTHDRAARAFALLKDGLVGDWSYAFIAQQTAPSVTADGTRVRDITRGHMIECGPCHAGMHPSARTLTVKDATALRPDPDHTRYRLIASAAAARLVLHRQEGGD